MINIACHCPAITDTTSFYRGIGPLSKLRKLDKSVNVVIMEGAMSWAHVSLTDLAFVQRPASPHAAQVIALYKKAGIPVWIDYDDDYFNIPKWNPYHKIYEPEDVQNTIRYCISQADIVTVSTKALKELYHPYNKNIVIIPNAWNDYVRPFLHRDVTKNADIYWRGSRTHSHDLELMKEAAISFSLKNSINWVFMGDRPEFFSAITAPAKVIEPMGVFDYYDYLGKANPKVFLSPLLDCPFNQAKSNLLWLEATFSGAVTITPPLAEWFKPGMIPYLQHQDGNTIEERLYWVYNNPKEVVECYEKSYRYIKDHLLLSNVNRQRLQIIKGLVK